ncbi:MAG: FUN14 domain-containing protein [Nitrospira sp.]|nr:FUN14 domain-containing protein [Nitrospira sp.]MDH5253509.1 FUN14 domain-containing protein [Nitrospira sp.]
MSDVASEPHSSLFAKALAAALADPPWAAKSFLAAGATTIAGLGAWLNDMMSPAMARGGASFIGGFLLGWALRKTLMIALLIIASLAVLIAFLDTAGWIHLDWAMIETDLSRTVDWVHGNAEGFKVILTGYLPSAGAGGAGAFFGFRKK